MIENTAEIISKNLNNPIKPKKILLSKEEKLLYFDNIVVTYPLMDEIINQMDYCKNSVKHSSQPECLSLVGSYRCGKTTIVETYMKKYPDIYTEEGIVKPILYCRVPCPATINGLVSSLLEAIGDPFHNKKGTSFERTDRLKALMKNCKVELIILDEVQHLIDSNRKKLIQDSSDWFKNLIADTNVPVVFVGLEYSLQIFSENKQLGSRVLNRYLIKDFDSHDKTFRIILHLFDKALPLENMSSLSQDGKWEYIYVACRGRLGYLKVLLKEALNISIDENYKEITFPILSKAYEKKLKHLYDKNPFMPGYDIKSEIKIVRKLDI